MATFMIRNLPDEIHRALRLRAVNHGRSLEAEVRAIIESKIQDFDSMGLGSKLDKVGKNLQGFHFDIALSSEPKKKVKGALSDLA
jgi:plasmid stability protein